MRTCAHLIWKAKPICLCLFIYSVPNSISNFIQNSTGQKKTHRNVLGVRLELLLSIVYRLVFSLTDSKMGYVHVFAGSQVRRPVSYLQITNIFLFKFTSLLRIFHSYRKYSTIGKPPDTPASRTCHVPHVTSAGLEPTPATTVG